MAPENVLPELSASTVRKLNELRAQEDKEDFYLHIASLRRNSWPLRAIADPLGVSRSIVNIWETKIDPLAPLPPVESLPKQISEQVKPIYSKYDLSPEDAQTLWDLAREASKVRRYTDQDSPSREAARELEDLLHFHKEKGASLNTLKNACGVSRRAIAQRLEKRDRVRR